MQSVNPAGESPVDGRDETNSPPLSVEEKLDILLHLYHSIDQKLLFLLEEDHECSEH